MSVFKVIFRQDRSRFCEPRQSQTFILEPILTPSAIVEPLEESLEIESDETQEIVESAFSAESEELTVVDTEPTEVEISGEELETIPFIDRIEEVEEEEALSFFSPESGNLEQYFVSEAELNTVKQETYIEDFDATDRADNGEENLSLEVAEPSLSATTQGTFSSGRFVVGETGEVGIDYLFDGGKYKGELAIFSLEGMDEYDPDTDEFMAEAARRSQSDSELGHIVIRDRQEGARFSGELGERDYNSGTYEGVKTFTMRSGDSFAMMFVPKGQIETVADNPGGVSGARRPVFSLATTNTDDYFQLRQLVDVAGDGNTFAFEDIHVNEGSDSDYNDFIFRVEGAVGNALDIDDAIDPELDWRDSELGQELIEYARSASEEPSPEPEPEEPVAEEPSPEPEPEEPVAEEPPTEPEPEEPVAEEPPTEPEPEEPVAEEPPTEPEPEEPVAEEPSPEPEPEEPVAEEPPTEPEPEEPVAEEPSPEPEPEEPVAEEPSPEPEPEEPVAEEPSPEPEPEEPVAEEPPTEPEPEEPVAEEPPTEPEPEEPVAEEPSPEPEPEEPVAESSINLEQRPEGVDPLDYSDPNFNPNDPEVVKLLNSYQWHLRSDENPDADANISRVIEEQNITGKGVVIGIIDNGFEVDDPEKNLVGHPDLAANYRADLSYDFDENDAIPSRVLTSQLIYQEELRSLDNGFGDFLLYPTHSGVIQKAILNLDIDYESVEDLNIKLHWLDGFEQHTIPLTEVTDGRYSLDLTSEELDLGLQGKPGNTPWYLEIIDPNFTPGKTGEVVEFSIDLETLHAHGTGVAGITSAEDNQSGVRGVAPDSQWAGLRVGGDGTTDEEITRALSHQSDEIDIYNSSWGFSFFNSPFPLALSAVESGARDGRNGLGNIYVFAGGNNGAIGGNANYNSFANSRHTIAVGAIDSEGKQAFYSSPGAPLLVSAYSDNGTPENYVGITTTGPYSDDGDDSNDYFPGTFGGTSAATPIVSGIVALMLEANPNLTARDVQHILVKSAQKNDPTNDDWTQNGAGHWVNHNYGFGAVDAEAAVNLAKTWTTVAEEVQISETKNVNKRLKDKKKLKSKIKLKDDNAIALEWVEIELNADHQYKGDLEIVLEHIYRDESGKKQVSQSILSEQHFNPQYQFDDNSHTWKFTSARHWDEPSGGQWKLTVRDKKTGNDSPDNYWHDWTLNLYGTQ
ncbi:S8 family serine peptidase [Roseofilum casamattae]|uniref:S8 family serine peptidase n=1 Tax=Roseofilum casamattae BLCC-M143 TaxID=3022442 RepID=A0ABT7BUH0_9CYAN|nr:S8 family serine peptidase [Roseofilum casamattae]MDJ1182164.1 S8 family serine peptidase [Roseofilum casamattae BLCC-M143]